jgi:type I restriction enzyme S subunit
MKLEKVLKYKKGKSPQKGQNDENLILYLTPEYLRGNSMPNYIPDFPTKVEVNDGDLLLLWDGSNAGEFFKGKKGILSSTMVRFDFDKLEYNSDFLFYQLKAFEGYLKAQTNGSGIPHVDKEILLGLEIEDFKKPEQTSIAEILSTADEAIAHTEALIAKYQRIKTGLMQDLLTKGIDENGNIRSKATHKFVVKSGIEVPEEWEVVELSSLVEKDSPIVYGILMPGYGYENGIPVVKVKDIKDEQILLNDLLLTSPEIAKSYDRSSLKEGDLLFTIRGTVGRCAFVPKELEGANITQDTARIRVSSISPHFLRYCFELESLKRYIELHTIGQAVKGINLKDLRKMPIPKPLLNESDLIAQRIYSIQNIIGSQISYLNKLQSLKTGLMQDLLSGKVRLPVEMIMEAGVNMYNKN